MSISPPTHAVSAVDSDPNGAQRPEAHCLRDQRVESMGLLVSGVAHDLSNALAPILMSVEQLGAAGADRHSKLLSTIKTGAEHCVGLVRQLLAFARGAEGSRTPIDLVPLATQFADFIRPLLGRNIRLDIDLLHKPPIVRADATQLQQVLMNLCINARDAMSRGGRIALVLDRMDFDELRAPAGADARLNSYAVLSVVDTGSGIPPEIIDRIFDPFFTTKGLGKGTGLGLPTAKSIVKSLGGFFAVESQEGRGTTIRIFLPADARQLQGALSL